MTKPTDDTHADDDDDDLDNIVAQSPKINEQYGNDKPSEYKSELLDGRSGGHYWKHPLSNSLFNTFNEYIKN